MTRPLIEKNLSVNMVRDDLDGLPQFAFPEGYSTRHYQPGDEKLWVDIHVAADVHIDVTEDVFWRNFDRDLDIIRERMLFIVNPEQTVIGTASAWYNDDFNGESWGRIHWVAIVPSEQGKGLAKPLMSEVCQLMKELGHHRAYLVTSAARLPAINLYFKFGFEPQLRHQQDEDVWAEIKDALGR